MPSLATSAAATAALASMLIASTAAQPDAFCADEILAITRATSEVNDANCALLTALEHCIALVTDSSERTQLEVELTHRQSLYQGCVAVPLPASIRTSRQAIDFQGADFTFHRTTRQSLNLYDLESQVDGYESSISSTESAISSTQSMMQELSGVQSAQGSSISSMELDIAGIQFNMSMRLGAVVSTQQSLAAALTASQVCVPNVEYQAQDGSCVLLNYTCDSFGAELYERVRPTRTSDRRCAVMQICSSNEYEAFPGSTHENRVCTPVTNCSALTPAHFVLQEATPTSDRVCSRGPFTDCRTLHEIAPHLPSGHYPISSAGGSLQLYCDMTTDGGGWTMFARGNGNERSCWFGSTDCNVNLLGPSQVWNTGRTARMSDARISGFYYTRIRFSGHGLVQGNQYWRGKDAGGCTYRHRTDSTGACNCASLNVDMRDQRCGSAHSTHEGVGDWPNNGGLHSMHTGQWWYFKRFASHGSHNNPNGYCYGAGTPDCDVALWFR